MSIPRVVLAAPGSGHGKTSVATGLIAALRRRGLRVSPHKVGPDYIDPSYHALAAGRPGRNLDPWLVGEQRIAALFRHGATTPVPADIAVIEGVMGLFDGASAQPASLAQPSSLTPGLPAARDFASTAHVARLLDAPVVLVVDASGTGASVGALVHGFATFDARTSVAGVILNQVGSDHHTRLLADAVQRLGIPLLGVVHRHERLSVPSRHLGLVPAAERRADAVAAVEALGSVVAAGVDLDAVVRVAAGAPPLPQPDAQAEPRHPPDGPPVRIALASGAAFTFGYAEHPELLAAAGAEVVGFDPLTDEALPEGVDGLVIGGGFPQVHAEALSANERLRGQVARLARAGAPVLAECAGLLYLSRTLDGVPMCAVLDVEARMTDRLTLGYREAVAATDSALATAGTTIRGHEFHRTVARSTTLRPNAWRWTAGEAAVTEGYVVGNVHASYLHSHWSGSPQTPQRLVAAARRYHRTSAARR